MSINKSNILSQLIKHDLSSLEQKMLDLVISQIDSKSKEPKDFYFIDLKDFAEKELNKENYTNYNNLKKTLEHMVKKGFRFIENNVVDLEDREKRSIKKMIDTKKLTLNDIIEFTEVNVLDFIFYLETIDLSKKQREELENLRNENSEELSNYEKKDLFTTWFSSVETYTRSQIVKVGIPQALMPYYQSFNGRFNAINAKDIYKLKSKYSIRLYELMSSYKSLNKKQKVKKGKIQYEDYIEKSIPYKTLKEMLGLENKYKDYRGFKTRVLNVAKEELKKKDVDFYFDYSLNGRGEHKHIIFKIYNNKKKKIKENKAKKEELINNSDNLDKKIYTEVEEALKKGGVSPSVRNSLITEFDEMRLRRNIDMQYKRLAEDKITRKELPGAMVKSIKEDWAMGNYEQKQEYKKNKEKKTVGLLPIEPEINSIEEKVKEISSKPDLYQIFIKFLMTLDTPKALELLPLVLEQDILEVYQDAPHYFNLVDKFWSVRDKLDSE